MRLISLEWNTASRLPVACYKLLHINCYNSVVKHPTDNTRYFFYGLLGIVLAGTFWVISPFMGTITLAFLTSVMFQPMYRWFLKYTKNRETFATWLTMVSIVMIVLIPLFFMAQLTVTQLIQFSSDIRNYTAEHEVSLEAGVSYLNDLIEHSPYEIQEITVEQARRSIEQSVSTGARIVADQVLRTGALTLGMLSQLFVYLFLVYYFLPIQKRIPQILSRLSPLDDELDYMFINKSIAMAQSMILGTGVIAVVQALIAGAVLFVVGTPYILFWILLMVFLGIIPVLGTSVVLVPAGIIFLLSGQIWQGLFIFAVLILVITNVDNILRPYLVSKQAELHPAFILIGVLGGLKVFGLLGVIYGPVIMILLVTMLIVFEKVKNGTQPQSKKIAE